MEGEADEEYGKKPGSVIIEVHQQPHAVFERKNHDLYATIKISLAEAVCGFSRTVLQHLDGRGIRTTVSPGTVIRPNEIIKIKGEGMPIPRTDTAGDLYLYVDIIFPDNGWCIENSELRKIRDVLPVHLETVKDYKIPENQIDDVDFTIDKKSTVSVLLLHLALTNFILFSFLSILISLKKIHQQMMLLNVALLSKLMLFLHFVNN